jgi:hypothetical protein
MNSTAWPLVLILAGAAAAVAQPSQGYLLAGVGSRDRKATSQAALGGEWVLKRGIGVGGELGLLAGHDSFGFFSGNGYYHPASFASRPKLDPFFTGGGGVAFRLLDGAGMANLGGGVNYWFHPRLGLRLEARDMLVFSGGARHFWGFRIGLAIH